ncbi:MAG TPA: pentapeptide repeat-containing protein [Streptosporangiaceae bacterium]|nr:pentapeptide repeat-containing protein [Streptosporangiaceae bacterium]
MTLSGATAALLILTAPSAAAAACPAVDMSPPYTVTPAPTPGVDWAGCDLSYGDLAGFDMTGANLTGANLLESDLAGTDLQNASLTNASLTSAYLGNANLTDADLTNDPMENVILTGANLTGANLEGTDLSYATSGKLIGEPADLPANWQIVDATLVGPTAVLAGADFSNANLANADLSEADLYEANLTSATLTGADLTETIFAGANLTDADLSAANLSSARLQNTNMQGTNLSGATLTMALTGGITGTPAALPANWQLLSGAGFGYLIGPGAFLQAENLDGANLSGSDLDGADIAYSDLVGASLASANLTGARMWNEDLTGASLTDANLSGADLTGARLTNGNLDGATYTSATIWSQVLWSNTICPNGLNSNKYLAGCFSVLDTQPPVAHPGVPYGTPGLKGWWISPVTVYWFWTDNGTIVSSQCQNSTSTNASGDPVTLTASCTDLAGNVGTASVNLKIDNTRPRVSVTGVRNGARYLLGHVPRAACRTTEAISGVATRARLRVTGGRHGLGRFTATCSGAVSVAGTTQARPVRVTFTVVRRRRGGASAGPATDGALPVRKRR